MRLLLCNDDGIHSPGITTLARKLAENHEVYVVAPDRERSAAGHSLTLHQPLRVEQMELGYDNGMKAWATDGTPGDCVKLAFNVILDEKPNILISGINNGPNLGADILYSGTVSAAMEGAVLGCPSIAVSLCRNEATPADFCYAAEFIAKFVPKIANINFPKKTILNINIPAVKRSEITGIKITKLGTRMYTDTYEKRKDPRGKTYYWLAGELLDTCEEENSDIIAIKNNKISITPITFEMTHKSIMPELEQAFCNGLCEP
ncbi:MAG TPA: 5'/3'-nucleotidase SurE [Candidatus Gastranaerophilales bacterium]|nr:5'/3'-nucleotidase SurE [Candidatus Gastranaerophilales bacterium]